MPNRSIKTIDALQCGNEFVSLLESGAKIPLLVTGYSMLPFLRHERDTVWLEKAETLRCGQIVFFRRSAGSFILHRIRRIYPDGSLLVNGDAQSWCEVVPREQVVAVVRAIERDGKIRDAEHSFLRIRDFFWYPTRPIRPLLFRLYGTLRKLLNP